MIPIKNLKGTSTLEDKISYIKTIIKKDYVAKWPDVMVRLPSERSSNR